MRWLSYWETILNEMLHKFQIHFFVTMIKCKVCSHNFKDLLKHLRKSSSCHSEYDVEAIVENRHIAKKKRMRDYYYENQNLIREQQAEYKKANKDKIKMQDDKYYDTNACIKAQKRRFYQHFRKEYALRYITDHQIHLFLHTEGKCQPESIKDINHSIDYYDGLCKFCDQPTGIKLLGVNRQVCIGCRRAQCTQCQIEVSPDPELGCFHYSPDTGNLLAFLRDYCPLYSNPWFPKYQALTYYKNQKDCKICSTLKVEYPEYEIFSEIKSESVEHENWGIWEMQEIQSYNCNLCESKFYFLCEFDLHMRNHTKYGKNIAIIGIVSCLEAGTAHHNRVNEDVFVAIEEELMKVNGISAVLEVYGNQRLLTFSSSIKINDDITFLASVMLSEGADIESDMGDTLFDPSVLLNARVILIRNHFVTDKSTLSRFDDNIYRRKRFEELLLRWKDTWVVDEDSSWYYRNSALLTTRCSLQYPIDRYQSLPRPPSPDLSKLIRTFLWNQIRNERGCCCESKYFCFSSRNLKKCVYGCCGICQERNGNIRNESSYSGFDDVSRYVAYDDIDNSDTDEDEEHSSSSRSNINEEH